MSDTNFQTPKSDQASRKPQDIGAWLKKPLTLTAPTWAFAAAGLVAVALLAIALD